MLHAKIKKG